MQLKIKRNIIHKIGWNVKRKKNRVFVFQKYGKVWRVSLGHFVKYEPLILKSIRWVQDDILGFVPSSCRFLKELYFKFRKIEKKKPKIFLLMTKYAICSYAVENSRQNHQKKNFFGTCHAMVNFLQTIKQFEVFLFWAAYVAARILNFRGVF